MVSKIFDTKRVAREMGIPEEDYEKLEKEIKEEFPKDEMMFELQFLESIEISRWQNGVEMKS
jgi:hypothetical protein